MESIDKLKEISASIPKQIGHIQTEEATKNAFVLPFISSLGYNIFDPTEVVPEFTADVGTKKGEKVDYALMIDGKPSMLIECKSCDCNLDTEHASQLYRYFSVTEARFGVLTNGINYKFYTDIEEPNKMDEKPFFEFDMTEIKERELKELKKFTKSSYDLDKILTSASELKYTGEIKKIIAEQVNSPSDDFVRFFAKQAYSGILTPKLRDKFVGITKSALNQFIKDEVSNRLKTALEASDIKTEEETNSQDIDPSKDEIVTTEEEWEGYYIVKAILHEIIDPERVVMRDTRSYCGILLDNNNRRPICRLRFNGSKKYVGVFNEEKREEKVLIEKISDIYKHSDKLKETVNRYDKK